MFKFIQNWWKARQEKIEQRRADARIGRALISVLLCNDKKIFCIPPREYGYWATEDLFISFINSIAFDGYFFVSKKGQNPDDGDVFLFADYEKFLDKYPELKELV